MAREPGAAFFAGGRFAVGEDGGEYAALPRNSAVGPDVTNRCVSCHDIAVGANPLAGAAAAQTATSTAAVFAYRNLQL